MLKTTPQQNAAIGCSCESRGSLILKTLRIYDGEGSMVERKEEDLGDGGSAAE